MRRIYESDALRDDDADPHMPTANDDGDSRTIRWEKASHALMPERLRPRAITVSVETDRETYAPDDTVGFRVEFANRLPLPVVIRTTSPVRWTWALNGLERASKVTDDPPQEATLFEFARRERKRFTRRWSQRIRVGDREWETADPGEYTLSVGVNAARGADRLRDETTFRVE